jgi:UDP-N-acetylglucosamine--N-acetylmuramyl-(pentapeptide) pyrophosphoryl-undecaprenol N-acetylglucosamine transferase
MNACASPEVRVAIACGGTGGHLFPGLAVADQLVRRGCAVTLLVSPKEVDQEAVKSAVDMEVVTLPAVGLQRGSKFAFVRGFCRSYFAAKKLFRSQPPRVALAMGGFTSAPPLLAARAFGARTFLHESNAIPGRANRWLSRVVDRAFVGFPSAAARLHTPNVTLTGTPIRSNIRPASVTASRTALGLDPASPVMAVMGGSQGASGINEMVISSLPMLADTLPSLQWFHLSGPSDFQKVKQAYAGLPVKAVVHPFFAGMELVLASASAVISRAGASSLAEFAALRLPAILVPYPFATDDHQLFNAKTFADTDAALLLPQSGVTPQRLVALVRDVVDNPALREKLRNGLEHWHSPRAASQIADEILHAANAGSMSRRGRKDSKAGAATDQNLNPRLYEPVPRA